VNTNRTCIIAEAGVNHNGSLALAKQLIETAAAAGADFVKFQSFRAEDLVTASAVKADYQKETTGADESQFEMLRRLELSADDHIALIAHCRKVGIEFLSAPFGLEMVDLLRGLGQTTWKIPSGEITNLPYLRKIGALRQTVILSTGMSTLDETAAALAVLRESGTADRQITILHGPTEYPALLDEVNLRAMQTLAAAFPQVRIGYSDHTEGISIAIAAVAMGAAVIEKHFTMDRSLPGPDHRASLTPEMLAAMVKAIREVERALGSKEKKPSPGEVNIRAIVRKSIVAAGDIPAGTRFTAENLTVKRPGTGVSPMLWDRILGTLSRKAYRKDDPIDA